MLPLILLFLFGYGVSLDANVVRIGVAVEAASEAVAEPCRGFPRLALFRRDARPATGASWSH